MDLKQSIAGINHKYWGFMLIFVAKTQYFHWNAGGFFQKLKVFTEKSRIFLKNSRFRKFQELELPEKASKKNP